jgi:hypothetical protein
VDLPGQKDTDLDRIVNVPAIEGPPKTQKDITDLSCKKRQNKEIIHRIQFRDARRGALIDFPT